MAEKNNATCSICGRGYHVCLSCRDSIQLAPWKIHTDTAEHYKVFQIIRGYNTNVYNKDEARNKLKNINLDDLESFRPHIKQIVKDILKKKEYVTENVGKTEKVEPIKTEDVTENNIEVIKTVSSRKRNYKADNINEL